MSSTCKWPEKVWEEEGTDGDADRLSREFMGWKERDERERERRRKEKLRKEGAFHLHS